MTYTDYKVQYREVPPDKPSVLGCLSRLVLLLAVFAFIGLATWITLFIISKT